MSLPSPTFLVLKALKNHGNQTIHQLWKNVNTTPSSIPTITQLKKRVLPSLEANHKIYKAKEPNEPIWTWRLSEDTNVREEWITSEMGYRPRPTREEREANKPKRKIVGRHYL